MCLFSSSFVILIGTFVLNKYRTLLAISVISLTNFLVTSSRDSHPPTTISSCGMLNYSNSSIGTFSVAFTINPKRIGLCFWKAVALPVVLFSIILIRSSSKSVYITSGWRWVLLHPSYTNLVPSADIAGKIGLWEPQINLRYSSAS